MIANGELLCLTGAIIVHSYIFDQQDHMIKILGVMGQTMVDWIQVS